MSEDCGTLDAPVADEKTSEANVTKRIPKSGIVLLLIYVGFGGFIGATLSVPGYALRKKLGERFYGEERRARFDTTIEIIQATIGTASSLLLSRWIEDPRYRLIVAQIGLTCSNIWTAFQYGVWQPTSDWMAYLPEAAWSCFGSIFLAETSVHEISRALHGGEAEGLYVTQTWMKAVKLLAVAGTQTLLSLTPDEWHPQTTAVAASCSILVLLLTGLAFRNNTTLANPTVTTAPEETLLSAPTLQPSVWRQITGCALAVLAVGLYTGQRGEGKFMYYMNRDVLKFTDGQVRLIAGIQYLAFSTCLCLSAHLQRKWSRTTRFLLAFGIIVSVISRVLNATVYHGDATVEAMRVFAYSAVAASSFGPVPEPILRTDALCGWRMVSLVKYSGLAMILVDRGGSLVLNPIYYALTVYCNANPFLMTATLLILAYACNFVSRRLVPDVTSEIP